MTRQYPEFYILRHGETEWNRAGRMQGALDSPLTETGQAQAAQQGDILAARDLQGFAWLSSPQGRALATAQIAARGHTIRTDARLSEITMGTWTGKTRSDLVTENPQLADSFEDLSWYDLAPEGEGLIGLETRVAEFLDDQTAPAVIFTHGITSRVLRCLLQGLPGEAYASLTGGQGIVYHLKDGQQNLLQ